ncbi:MAG: hydrogenobyrinic acid a,c-diamide synthase [Anaerocolumna sp.]|jgi:cobyrinic acid a,c-diamide synthase|nr:hydrogenobyrinic acid a,c-diamide synthase [Anaerocolumna sp.]
MIAGTKSGCGKTTITCGILKCIMNQGLFVSSFKCGPDYIDPMFHSKIIGTKSGNLDSYFTDSETLNSLFIKNSKDTDISVIEGVMGYYDGIGFTSNASSYSIATITKTPVILVLDCKGVSTSIGAILQGFLGFKADNNIKGVIFNQLPEVLYEDAKKLAKKLGVVSLGYVPVIKECILESRHLGLVTADEIEDIKNKIELLASNLENTLDINGMLQLSKQAEDLPDISIFKVKKVSKQIKIAIAMDNAFCFHYRDNLDLLTEMGCTLLPFSPLKDTKLPNDISGLLLNGGYPELYADELSKNQNMLKSIKQAIYDGIPTIAECGGFMYLHDTMEDTTGKEYPMVGVIQGKCYKTNRLQRFGYIDMSAYKDNLISSKLGHVKAHEFHYWDSESSGEDYHAVKASGTKEWDCIHATDIMYAGFPHLYYYSNPAIAEGFVNQCIKYSEKMRSN